MTDDLHKSLFQLKSNLENMEKDYSKKFNMLQRRENKQSILSKKTLELRQIQTDIIILNIGGEKIKVNFGIIAKSQYDSIIRDIVINLEQIGKGKENTKNVFIDRNPDTFYYIMEIFRNSNNNKIYLPRKVLLHNFISDINFYFKEDAVSVLEDFNIFSTNYENDYVNYQETNSIYESYEITTELPGTELDYFRAKSLQDIMKKNRNKAFFISYDSSFTIKFNEIVTISSIEIRPFTASLEFWVPSEGAGTFIFTKLEENDEWEFCNSIPDDYGIDIATPYFIDFDQKAAKYLKFQTGEFTLSISYLNIK